MIRFGDKLALAITALTLAWFFITSEWFINPTFVTIEDRTVRVSRTFPLSEWLGPPRISYVETIRPFHSTEICQDVLEYPVQYRENPANVGEWELGEWADDCLTGEPYQWTAEWNAWIGPFKLRQVSLSLRVDP